MINKDQYSGFEKELAAPLIEDDLVDQMAFIRTPGKTTSITTLFRADLSSNR